MSAFDTAQGEELDHLGLQVGVIRNEGECDFFYRARVRRGLFVPPPSPPLRKWGEWAAMLSNFHSRFTMEENWQTGEITIHLPKIPPSANLLYTIGLRKPFGTSIRFVRLPWWKNRIRKIQIWSTETMAIQRFWKFICLSFLVVGILGGCGKEPPWIQYFNPFSVEVKVPTTNDARISCPKGTVSDTAVMRFYQNGAPKHLEMVCNEVRIKGLE